MKELFKTGEQFSATKCIINKKLPLHWHNFYEMELVLSGSGIYYVNGNKHIVSRGSLLIATPIDFHEIIPDINAYLELVNLKFNSNMISEELRELIFEKCFSNITKFEGKDFSSIEAEFKRMVFEAKSTMIGQSLIIRRILEGIVIEVIRKTNLIKPEQYSKILKSSHMSIQKALFYIHHNFRKPIRLDDVAKLSNLCTNYFSERFHEVVGLTFQRYLQSLRLEFAVSILSSTELPITQICYAAGFNTLPTFIRCFKQKYGAPPSVYRDMIKKRDVDVFKEVGQYSC